MLKNTAILSIVDFPETEQTAPVQRSGWVRTTIEQMQVIAIERGGMCLSIAYGIAHTKLEWECTKGHRWFATPSNIKRGTWCRECAKDRSRSSLDDIIEIALARGGRCLSQQYINTESPLTFECEQGHCWQASSKTIREGHWCAACAHDKMRSTLQRMQEIAASRGGLCLSDTYLNNYHRLRWRCAQGHEWESNPLNVVKHWCAQCRDDKKRLGIARMQAIAAERDGLCLSTVYVNAHTHLTWKCCNGHIWQARPMDIVKGHWCNLCYLDRRTQEKKRRRRKSKNAVPILI
ncbi:hypothetical protein [Glaciimonas soli]|uniref:Zinc-ribbon domain-containing protein n=1 Tax=Glaciimonas soli TaxID=2590999 RepID=A0A843YWN8_9BURK|nr:hypothetical protein [Glaciimonas soli]MQR02084.1 hypothetical protein [Glaciimonas soli]